MGPSGLVIEQLEDRALLSANPLYNAADPYDVNGDGKVTPLDALTEIQYLNSRSELSSSATASSSSSPTAQIAVAAASSDTSSGGAIYPDVLDTGTVTPADALAEIRELNVLAADDSSDIVSLSLQAQNASGDQITSINVGQTFYLAAYATDLESTPDGVFAAYLNAGVTTGSATFAQPGAGQPTDSVFDFDGPELNSSVAGSTTSGSVVDAGAIDPSITYPTPDPSAPQLIWTVPVTATAAGTLTITPSAADPNTNDLYDVLVYSTSTAVPTSEIDFVPVSISVVGQTVASVGAASVSNSAVSDSTLEFPVTLSQASTADTVITYSTTDGTAISGTDYTGVSGGTITIPAGSTTADIPITVLPAAQVGEPNKTFTITLTGISNSSPEGAILGTATATGTIDNTDFPTVNLSGPASQLAPQSGSGTYDFTATLSQASQVPITLYYSTANGTGTSPTDYTGVTNGSVTIAAGQTTAQIPITIFNDPSMSTASFSVSLLPTSTSVTLGVTTEATGVIDDLPGLSVANVEQTSPPTGASTMTFTATLTQAAVSNITLDYSTGAMGDTALAGTEYTAVSNGTVTIPAGSLSATFTVPLLSPTIYEGQTEFTVNLSLPLGENDVALSNTTAIGTIDPAVAQPTLSIAATPAAFDDPTSGSPVYPFTVTLSTLSGVATTFSYTTVNQSAIAGVDYTATTGTGTIAAGSLTTTINVPVTAYDIYEPTKTFEVQLSNLVNANPTGSMLTAVGTIDNSVTAPTISLNTPTYTDVTSGMGSLPVVVSLSSVSGSPVSFDYATSNGTAIAGTNYTATSGSATIAAGQTSVTIDVPVDAEPLYTPSLNFTFSISSATNVSGPTSDSTTATIVSAAAEPSLSIGNYSAPVSSTSSVTFPFTVTLSAASSVATTVNYATANGTATAGVDFVAASGTLTIPAGQTTGVIDVTVNPETITSNRTFTVVLSDPTNATLSTSDVGTGTLQAYLPSSISGYVFLDVNGDKIKESNEQVLSGVAITLTGTSTVSNTAVSMSTTTSSTGAYSFTNLQPGEYVITEGAAPGYIGAEAIPDAPSVTAQGTNQLAFDVDGLGNINTTNDDFAFLGQAPGTISQRGYLSSTTTTTSSVIVVDSASGSQATAVDAASGSSSALAASLASHVTLSGTTLTITGTGGDDNFSFTAGASVDTVTFDGVEYTYNAASLTAVNFIGTGQAAATLTGLGGATATAGLGFGTLTGAGYTVTVKNVNALTINGGGAGSTAVIQNSAAVDYLLASGDVTALTDGSGDSLTVDGFSSVTDQSNSSGTLSKNIGAIDFALKTI